MVSWRREWLPAPVFSLGSQTVGHDLAAEQQHAQPPPDQMKQTLQEQRKFLGVIIKEVDK